MGSVPSKGTHTVQNCLAFLAQLKYLFGEKVGVYSVHSVEMFPAIKELLYHKPIFSNWEE